MSLSPQQEEVVAAVTAAVLQPKTPVRHFCIQACAGSGKTRTLLGVVDSILQQRPEARILLLAFARTGTGRSPCAGNRDMAAELQRRLSPEAFAVDVHTIHAFGLLLCDRPGPGPPLQDPGAPQPGPARHRRARRGAPVQALATGDRL